MAFEENIEDRSLKNICMLRSKCIFLFFHSEDVVMTCTNFNVTLKSVTKCHSKKGVAKSICTLVTVIKYGL